LRLPQDFLMGAMLKVGNRIKHSSALIRQAISAILQSLAEQIGIHKNSLPLTCKQAQLRGLKGFLKVSQCA
jgi:hypothetical protein